MLSRICWSLTLSLAILGCSACGNKRAATPAPVAAALADPHSESLGGISLGTSGPEVEKLLGAPSEKSPTEEVPATGDMISIWIWATSGTQLHMAMSAESASVNSMTIEAPSKLTTSRGIGIGATRAEVERVYRDAIGTGREPDEPDSTSPEQLIIGSIYGGTFFEFTDAKVSRIFVGAGAE